MTQMPAELEDLLVQHACLGHRNPKRRNPDLSHWRAACLGGVFLPTTRPRVLRGWRCTCPMGLFELLMCHGLPNRSRLCSRAFGRPKPPCAFFGVSTWLNRDYHPWRSLRSEQSRHGFGRSGYAERISLNAWGRMDPDPVPEAKQRGQRHPVRRTGFRSMCFTSTKTLQMSNSACFFPGASRRPFCLYATLGLVIDLFFFHGRREKDVA